MQQYLVVKNAVLLINDAFRSKGNNSSTFSNYCLQSYFSNFYSTHKVLLKVAGLKLYK